jgi:hypothetical protein
LKRYLNPRSDGRGYLCVNIDGKTYKAHLVVALVIHGEKPSPKHLVMHKDNDKHNLRPSNIKYGLPSENMKQAARDGLMKHKKRRRAVMARIYATADGIGHFKFVSITKAAKFFGVSPGTIHSALTGKSKTAAGYKWSYA